MSNVCFAIKSETADISAECEGCDWSGDVEAWVEIGQYLAECPDCGDDIVILF